MILSNGTLKTPSITVWQNRSPFDGIPLLGQWSSYGQLYRSQLWVNVVVNKRARSAARLPLKTYRRTADGREDARDQPFGQLLRRPNNWQDPFTFWEWTVSTLDVYGEVFWGKVRDRAGRPVMLAPLHPTTVFDEERDGRVTWRVCGPDRDYNIERRDLVHHRFYNPAANARRGMSQLEPLRSTLENEDGARRANSALWRNGGRPSVLLQHPGKLSEDAGKRLSSQWRDLHGSVDNWGKTAILEEGMNAQVVQLNVEELQYIEARRLNREEVCAAYDMPPPVVHILDRATFSNITEQMRSLYRDTMAPLLGKLESTIELELRDGRTDVNDTPDFPEDQYAEFLLDEVLRGAFEDRAQAYQSAINSGQMTPAEAREKENLPFLEGSDRLFLNSTLVPIDQAGEVAGDEEPGEPFEARSLRTVMGRLSRIAALADIDADALVAGLNGDAAVVKQVLDDARAEGDTVDGFKARLHALKG